MGPSRTYCFPLTSTPYKYRARGVHPFPRAGIPRYQDGPPALAPASRCRPDDKPVFPAIPSVRSTGVGRRGRCDLSGTTPTESWELGQEFGDALSERAPGPMSRSKTSSPSPSLTAMRKRTIFSWNVRRNSPTMVSRSKRPPESGFRSPPDGQIGASVPHEDPPQVGVAFQVSGFEGYGHCRPSLMRRSPASWGPAGE